MTISNGRRNYNYDFYNLTSHSLLFFACKNGTCFVFFVELYNCWRYKKKKKGFIWPKIDEYTFNVGYFAHSYSILVNSLLGHTLYPPSWILANIHECGEHIHLILSVEVHTKPKMQRNLFLQPFPTPEGATTGLPY